MPDALSKNAVPPVVALAAFLAVAAIDEPTALDWTFYDLAKGHYDHWLELAQRPVEVLGLPGAYIPAAYLLARWMRQRGKRGGAEIIAAAWSGWLAVRTLRLVVHRPRPPRPRGRGPKRESTFPSGHTVGLTTLALVVADVLAREGLLDRRAARVLGLGMPLIVGANRVYVREHWLTDVLGGWTLGAAVAGTVSAVRRKRRAAEGLAGRNAPRASEAPAPGPRAPTPQLRRAANRST
jgi:undecaprenyl-diphosphatase